MTYYQVDQYIKAIPEIERRFSGKTNSHSRPSSNPSQSKQHDIDAAIKSLGVEVPK